MYFGIALSFSILRRGSILRLKLRGYPIAAQKHYERALTLRPDYPKRTTTWQRFSTLKGVSMRLSLITRRLLRFVPMIPRHIITMLFNCVRRATKHGLSNTSHSQRT
jgi:hypothetical protein